MQFRIIHPVLPIKGKTALFLDFGGRHIAPTTGLKQWEGRAPSRPWPKRRPEPRINRADRAAERGAGKSQKDPGTYATAYYRFSGNFAKVNYKRDTKLRYVGKSHMACLLIMFVSRRLAMPPLRRETVRHATLLFCAEGVNVQITGAGEEREMLLSEDVVKPRQRDCRNSVVERVCFANGSYDICRVGANRIKSAVGAFPDGWRSRSLAFESHSLLSSFDDEIHLGTASCAVERNVCIRIQASDVGQHHLLPASAERRMRVDFIERLESQKRARQTSVAEIYLGHLYKPLAEVGHERGDDIHHERLFEQIDVSPDSHVGDAERRRKPRTVDHLRVLMCKHLPKPTHRFGHEIPPEHEIPFKKSLDERFVPIGRFVIVRRKVGTGESAADETLCPIRSLKFAEEKWSQPLIADPTGQRLGALADEIARSGTEDEEMSVSAPFVAKASDHGEQVALALDFVNADKFSAVAGEKQFGIGELCQVGWSFEVKIDGIAQFFAEMFHQSGLSALAGSHHCGHRVSLKCPPYAFLKLSAYVCAQALSILADSTSAVEFSRVIISRPLCAVKMGRGRRLLLRKCFNLKLNKARHSFSWAWGWLCWETSSGKGRE